MQGRTSLPAGRALPVVVVMALLLGACGGGSETSDEPGCVDTDNPGVNSCVVVVPDPRPGDLRSDPDADVLPVDYTAPEADATMLDVGYGDDPEQRLDLYLPAEPFAPVIVFVHSGGWISGGREAVPSMVLRFVERGYAVASIGYRLAPDHPFPASVEDVKRAIRWLRVFSQEEGLIDGDRIVAFGTSAGGHIAAMVAATPGRFEPTDLTDAQAAVDSTVVGVVSVVGPTDLTTFSQPDTWAEELTEALLGCAPCGPEALADASPVTYMDHDLPPAYWVYGENDELVDAVTQGAVAASAWAVAAGESMSWFDLVGGCGHNIDCSTVNQRSLEDFVDRAVSDAG